MPFRLLHDAPHLALLDELGHRADGPPPKIRT
jgi:hypothetical protein